MNVNRGIFIPVSAWMVIGAVWTLSFTSAPSIGQVPAAGSDPFLLVSAGNDPARCPDRYTAPLTEGPYYRKGSPQRTDLLEAGTVGAPFTLSGYVFDENCAPIAGAWLDFWQADGGGNYDNQGYGLRGHQFTDEQGRYRLRAVIPGEYAGRTTHIHVKVARKEGGVAIASQLYFPDSKRNTADPFFSDSMLIKLDRREGGGTTGRFDFRLSR